MIPELTVSGTQPLFGKAYTFFSKKWLFIGCVTIFEVGSIICAAGACSHASQTLRDFR